MEVTVESSHVTLRLIILEMRASVSLTEKKTCCLHLCHRPFCGCSAKWKQSLSEHTVLGWFLQKEVAENHLHTHTHISLHLQKDIINNWMLFISDSERNLSWKDFYGKCFFFKVQLIRVIPTDLLWLDTTSFQNGQNGTRTMKCCKDSLFRKTARW